MRKLILLFGCILWLTTVTGGLYAVARFDFGAGPKHSSPQKWPSTTRLEFQHQSHNLVLALHPMCSCSTATLAELEQIIAVSGDALKVHALIALPEDSPDEWKKSSLVERLRKLPRTEIILDQRGEQADLFGALTSGDSILFSPEMTMLFRGGITASRGHVGENVGRYAIIDLVAGRDGQNRETPVFGCSLRGITRIAP